MRDHNPAKVPAEGWVLVNVGHPGAPGAPPPQATNPPLQHGLQRKRSFPPMSSQRPPPTHSPYSTGSRGAPAELTVGGHKKGHSNYNPSSMSPAAKAIVVFDAIEAKRKAPTGDTSQSGFRKFFSLARPDSPGKSPGKKGSWFCPAEGARASYWSKKTVRINAKEQHGSAGAREGRQKEERATDAAPFYDHTDEKLTCILYYLI
ncbi:hypothetical protein EDB84DRAFT_1564204 [Lactarius hengduanensis]|nr:hypothetical protein EDB84DRAFT_1564204 [Lactarius hengduanensis]